jgi:hypothetical protein
MNDSIQVAARLAGGRDHENATAGKPWRYR